jgi:hypothetical protein
MAHFNRILTDLAFWYGDGPGSPAAAALGIGYVTEHISRLTKQRIEVCDTTVDCTIVQNATLFPFDQPIYVEATHKRVVSASEELRK